MWWAGASIKQLIHFEFLTYFLKQPSFLLLSIQAGSQWVLWPNQSISCYEYWFLWGFLHTSAHWEVFPLETFPFDPSKWTPVKHIKKTSIGLPWFTVFRLWTGLFVRNLAYGPGLVTGGLLHCIRSWDLAAWHGVIML